MINVIDCDEFKKTPFGKHHSLNLHAHTSRKSKAVAVFVHGLNGSGYGTWKNWPKLVFEDPDSPMDVALYYYPSFFRAVRHLQRGADIDVQAEQLTEHLEKLGRRYSEVYIIAHSLGGLVAEEAVSLYLQKLLVHDGTHPAVTPIAAIFLMASPRSGSGKALFPFWIFRDVYRLRHLSKEHARSSSFFSSNVQVQALASTGGYRFLLPRYAGIATLDVAVSSTSASGSIPEVQQQRFKGNHFSVVKPSRKDDPQHLWLLQSVKAVREIRTQWGRDERHRHLNDVRDFEAPPFIVTKMRGEYRRSDWDALYTEVRQSASRPYADVIDHEELKPGTKIDLLITINDSANVLSGVTASKRVVDRAIEDFEAGRITTAGICPIGARYSAAEAEVRKWLNQTTEAQFYVEGSADMEGLRDRLTQWIDVVMLRHPDRQLRNQYTRVALNQFDNYEEVE